MPDLVGRSRLYRHDVHSALASLSRLGIGLEQIVFRYREGSGHRDSIVGQSPAAGSPLVPGTRVTLDISGTGTLLSLPYALREDSEPGEMAGDALCQILDVPLARSRVFVQQAAGHFRLSPDVTLTALRWIRDIMRVSAEPWDPGEWYRIARLLAKLPTLSGRADAIATALGFVYGLPVSETRLLDARLPLDTLIGARLGVRNGRLGVDSVVGDGLVVAHTLHVTIGPVPLATYREHVALSARRHALYRLLTPVFLPGGVIERWTVERRVSGYRLGARDEPAMLGVSSYFFDSSFSAKQRG